MFNSLFIDYTITTHWNGYFVQKISFKTVFEDFHLEINTIIRFGYVLSKKKKNYYPSSHKWKGPPIEDTHICINLFCFV